MKEIHYFFKNYRGKMNMDRMCLLFLCLIHKNNDHYQQNMKKQQCVQPLCIYVCFYQEHLNYVSEISQEEIFILDPELVVMMTVATSPSAMPDLVNPSSSLVNSR